MKRLLITLVALIAVFAMVLPAAAVELQFGGLYWTKYYHTSNLRDGDDDLDDQIDGFYTRMRLYFTGVGSENVKVVSRFEIDNIWGQDALGSQSADDKDKWEVKNIYLDFNVPDTPLNLKVGTQAYKLGGGTVFNDDTSAIVADLNFQPVRVGLVYSRLGSDGTTGSSSAATGTDQHDDTNLWGADVRYQMSEELRFALGLGYFEGPSGAVFNTASALDDSKDFNMVVVALDVDYKADMFALYLTAALDSGEDKGLDTDGDGASDKVDYEGYFVTLGGTYNATDMVSVGADFYYTSGDDDSTDDNDDSFHTFGGISRPSYNMDETLFPGWFDDETAQATTIGTAGATKPAVPLSNNLVSASSGTQAGFFPANMLALGAHVDLKPADMTFIQVGGAYMMPMEDVDTNGDGSTDGDDAYGTSIYARLQQGIVDGVQLKVVAGYLFTDDGYAPRNASDDAYRLAMGVFYNW
jgi:hypothetical protein